MLWFLLCLALWNPAQDKHPTPSPSEQAATRERLRGLFKVEYAKTDAASLLALAEKLITGAAEERANPLVRYVMLAEALQLSVRAGAVDRAVKLAQDLDHDFQQSDPASLLAKDFAAHFGVAEGDWHALTAKEAANPTDPLAQADLAHRWQVIAKRVRAGMRPAALRRALEWSHSSLASVGLTGLARTEAEKNRQETMADLDRLDAQAGRFSLYAGKWNVRYDNGYIAEYVIMPEGQLAFDRCISPDGTVFHKKEESRGHLTRRGGVVVAVFAKGRILERFRLDGVKLAVDRFDPAMLYPDKPINTGMGERVK